ASSVLISASSTRSTVISRRWQPVHTTVKLPSAKSLFPVRPIPGQLLGQGVHDEANQGNLRGAAVELQLAVERDRDAGGNLHPCVSARAAPVITHLRSVRPPPARRRDPDGR